MSILSQTRRGFLKGALILSGGLMLGIRWTGRAYARVMEIKDTMASRIKSVYVEDTRFPKQASQDNVQVQKLYKDLYKKPLSELAEEHLHTEWFDRSQSIKELREKGVFPNPRFARFSKLPYPYED